MKKLFLVCTALVVVSLLAHSTQAQIIVAHRGLFLYPGYERAENTIPAIEMAYAEGYNAVELDIRVTSDYSPVIMHDNAKDPNTGVTANFAGFSPQRTTNWDGFGGNYGPLSLGAFSLDGNPGGCYLFGCTLPLNPSLTQMESNVSWMKIYNSAGAIIGHQAPGLPQVPYPWSLQEVLEYLSGSEWGNMTIVLDIQSTEAFTFAKSVVADVEPTNPIIFKVWTTAMTSSQGDPTIPGGWGGVPAGDRNLVVSDNMIERPLITAVDIADGTGYLALRLFNTTTLPNLKGMEYFLQGTSLDANILSDIQYAVDPTLPRWGVLRLYDFTYPGGAQMEYGGNLWTCTGQYIQPSGMCYMGAGTGKILVTMPTQVQANQNLLQNFTFTDITEDVYGPQ